ncbi:MAG: DUF3325 family protein [Bacteroidota bacterium]
MEYILILLASCLLFSKSRYFPKRWKKLSEITKKHEVVVRVLGYLLIGIAVYPFVQKWGAFTGIVFWITAIMFAFSIVLMIVPTVDWIKDKKIF